MRYQILLIVCSALVLFFVNCQLNFSGAAAETAAAQFVAQRGTPVIDGEPADAVWQNAAWQPLNNVWLGDSILKKEDFSGRYKLAWDQNNLYILAEITDDTLADFHPDGLDRYWDDDCLEIFLDEDASGGNHQYSYNAFAYHVALDGRVVDINPDSAFQYYDDHLLARRKTTGNVSVWEIAVKVFNDQYTDGEENIPRLLTQGKLLGFALAYCDNDRSPEREQFIGNVPISGTDKNLGWIDAGVFGRLSLE
jgi:hypothetical protein